MNLQYHHVSGYAEAIERDIALRRIPLSRMERGFSGALQQLYTDIVWRLDKSNSDTGANGTRWHSEDGATLGEFGVRGINVVDPQPKVVQAKIRLSRRRRNSGIGRDKCQEHRHPVDVQINSWPPVRLDGLDDFGIEHTVVILRRRHRVMGAEMDMVVAVYWHDVPPHEISGWVEMNFADLSASTCGARTCTSAASSCSKKVTLLSLLPQPRTMPWMAICSARVP